MAFTEEQVLEIVSPHAEGLRGRRFTQDTPVLPDVWVLFGTQPGKFHDLILTPHKNSSVTKLFAAIKERAKAESARRVQGEFRLRYNETHVLFRTNYEGLIRIVLPLSNWWREHVRQRWENIDSQVVQLREHPQIKELLTDASTLDLRELKDLTQPILDMIRIVGLIGLAGGWKKRANQEVLMEETLRSGIDFLREILFALEPVPWEGVAPLWQLFSDREVLSAIHISRKAVKADAAMEVFQADSHQIRWAVIDSGIDATHPAFRKRDKAWPASGSFAGATRIEKTLDFCRLEKLTSITISGGKDEVKGMSEEDRERLGEDLLERLQRGLPVEWQLLEAWLEIPHVLGIGGGGAAGLYSVPESGHGSHVAGIIGADWPEAEDEPMRGICPNIGLYDLRVTDGKGTGKESAVLAALQYVRFLNANKGRLVVHGVNLSLSMLHKVQSFACGCTPVCDEATRLVKAGIVVVAAAGNSGIGSNGVGAASDYRDISITDPGNAEAAITVGSTHSSMPHRFGVSYFSSRGPTGDGRMKPDLVAPGEGIRSTIPGGKAAVMDGTSQAAPHVSGAAALLMARHVELRGDPERVKEVLCGTATDLRRERTFQGAGMVDILRALQSV